jgi:hypothetical protein
MRLSIGWSERDQFVESFLPLLASAAWLNADGLRGRRHNVAQASPVLFLCRLLKSIRQTDKPGIPHATGKPEPLQQHRPWHDLRGDVQSVLRSRSGLALLTFFLRDGTFQRCAGLPPRESFGEAATSVFQMRAFHSHGTVNS